MVTLDGLIAHLLPIGLMSQSKDANAAEATKFGTIGGVFTPCVLTILGVIMFLRFGFVVGQAGVIQALVIVLAAKVITTLTTLSLSAIATNTRVKAGGAYFLISRSLGVEFGGAIGIVFFLAQAISVAMYVVGFAEAYTAVFPNAADPTIVATVTNVIVFICVFIGAGWTIKLQYGILALLVGSLISFYAGALPQFDCGRVEREPVRRVHRGQELLHHVRVVLPGSDRNHGRSQHVRRPEGSRLGRSRKGTLWAVLFTGIIYLSMAVVLGGATNRESLIG